MGMLENRTVLACSVYYVVISQPVGYFVKKDSLQLKSFSVHCVVYHVCISASTSCFYFRPNTGRSRFEETKSDLLNKYIQVSPEKAGEC